MDLLSKAFIDWYKYNHNYKNPETDNSVYLFKNIFNEIEFNEYLKDLNKFDLELSQINYTKLNKKKLTEYKLVEKHIIDLKSINIYNQTEFVNADIYQKLIYYSLYVNLEDDNLKMGDKISILFKNIQDINKKMKYMQNQKQLIKTKDFSNFSLEFNILLTYIENIPLKLNSDINTLDRLDVEIGNLKKNLYIFKKNVQEADYSNFSNFNKDKLFYNSMVSDYAKDYFNVNITKLENNKEFKFYLNSLFDLCEEYYLRENDEPVWIDIDDTLNVIKWVMENKLHKNRIKDSLIDEYYMSFNLLNKNLDKLDIKYNYDTPAFHIKNEEVDLFKNKSFISFKSILIDSDSSIFHNKYSINFDISNNMLINYYINQYKNTKLSYLISDRYYINGLSNYLQLILFENGFYSDDKLFKIYYDLEMMRKIVFSICQNNYFNEGYKKNHIIEDLSKFALLSNKESIDAFKGISKIDYLYINEISNYLIFLKSEKNSFNNYLKDLYVFN